MPDPIRLDTPGAISGADISSAPSADGTIFYSYQMARSGQPPLQVVRKRHPDGRTEQVPLPMQITGRGQLSVEAGGLVLTAWQETGLKTAWRIFVPGYVAFKPAAGPAGPAGPQGPKGEPGSGVLSVRYATALDRLCQFLGI